MFWVCCYCLFLSVGANLAAGAGEQPPQSPTNVMEETTGVLKDDPHRKTKKVLVTGAAGFIGSHVADALLARGDKVVIMDEVNDYYNVSIKEGNLQYLLDKYGEKRVRIYRGDVANETFVESLESRGLTLRAISPKVSAP